MNLLTKIVLTVAISLSASAAASGSSTVFKTYGYGQSSCEEVSIGYDCGQDTVSSARLNADINAGRNAKYKCKDLGYERVSRTYGIEVVDVFKMPSRLSMYGYVEVGVSLEFECL